MTPLDINRLAAMKVIEHLNGAMSKFPIQPGYPNLRMVNLMGFFHQLSRPQDPGFSATNIAHDLSMDVETTRRYCLKNVEMGIFAKAEKGLFKIADMDQYLEFYDLMCEPIYQLLDNQRR